MHQRKVQLDTARYRQKYSGTRQKAKILRAVIGSRRGLLKAADKSPAFKKGCFRILPDRRAARTPNSLRAARTSLHGQYKACLREIAGGEKASSVCYAVSRARLSSVQALRLDDVRCGSAFHKLNGDCRALCKPVSPADGRLTGRTGASAMVIRLEADANSQRDSTPWRLIPADWTTPRCA